MPDIACPSCGTVSRLEHLRREADEFCRVCDYPLFWARSTEFADGAAAGGNGESLRRLPGTAGRQEPASINCPACTEPNPVTGIICIRCGAELHPAPVIVEEPPPPPPPAPPPSPPPPPPVKTSRWPLVILLLAIVAAILIVILAVT